MPAEADDDRILLSLDDGIADVRLNRPDRINALDHAAFARIEAVGRELRARDDLRAVVLSGSGRGFSVGVDLADLAGGAEPLAPRTHGIANRVQAAAWQWRELAVPVIAAVHGFAFGAGFQLMLGADIRIIAPDAQLSLMEIRWGLIPDMAGIALLRGLVRDDVARELTYSGRKLSGSEALTLGLATRLAADPHAEAMAIARAIAAASPPAIRAAKRLFNLAADAGAAEILIAEAMEQSALLRSAEHRAAIRAAGKPGG